MKTAMPPSRSMPRCAPLLAFMKMLAGAGVVAGALAGCVSGPDFTPPVARAPADWAAWHGGDDALRIASAHADAALPERWWLALGDPLLDELERQAERQNADLLSAALRFAQARSNRAGSAAQNEPQLGVSAGITRQRQSEWGVGTRMLDFIGGNRARLASLLGEPFTLYQAGFDASWEPDLWGRVRRAVEAADADLARQAALYDGLRLAIAADVARNYVDVRSARRQAALLREEALVLEDRLSLSRARVRGGVGDGLEIDRLAGEIAALRAQLPGLLAQEAAGLNQLTLLLGQPPGALRDRFVAASEPRPGLSSDLASRLPPDLALGLPSEVALRRPDLRAAMARLHAATAAIGVASAELYPSIRLGARLGYESYLQGEMADWGSRAWSIGPSLSLPLFDQGRRKRVVRLRDLQQQEAAVDFHRAVLAAWQEIDDALSGYAAQREQAAQLALRTASTGDAEQLVRARRAHGAVDDLALLDARRSVLQARREQAAAQARLWTRFIAVNKALGNVPPGSPEGPAAGQGAPSAESGAGAQDQGGAR